MKIKNIALEDSTVKEWIQSFRPEFDLFFFTKDQESVLENFFSNSLIVPEKEFFRHSSYNVINLVNSYEYWGLSKESAYVCVAPPHVISSMDAANRMQILKIQKEMNSDHVYEWKFVQLVLDQVKGEAVLLSLLDYQFVYGGEQYVAIPSQLWRSLPFEFQQAFLVELAGLYVDEEALDEDWNQGLNSFPYISKYLNTFGGKHGSNCLGTSLAALASNKEQAEWILTQWVHDETFLIGLKNHDYELVPSSLEDLGAGDVIVWRNAKDAVIHACFHLGNGYFFNKNGQSFFNPWQVVTLKSLMKNWGTKGLQIYRKQRGGI